MDNINSDDLFFNDIISILGFDLVHNICTKGYYVDSYHPLCYQDPNNYTDYKSRKYLMDNMYDMIYCHRITGPDTVKLHDNFVRAEFEHIIRMLKGKKFTHHFQYAYLQNTHEWDPLIRSLVENDYF